MNLTPHECFKELIIHVTTHVKQKTAPADETGSAVFCPCGAAEREALLTVK